MASPQNIRRRSLSLWIWAIGASLFLGASGFVRINQERQFANSASAAERPPFPMKDLPTQIGPFQMVGDELRMEEETLQVAGCSDYILREYIDKRIGVRLTMLVAFGPAERVFGHNPTVCFPAFGYDLVKGPNRRNLGENPVGFDRLAYARPNGGANDLVEVYYSFWHADEWSPLASRTRKQFRHQPGMIKVQIERRIADSELGADDSPSEELLALMVPEIEKRLENTSSQSNVTE